MKESALCVTGAGTRSPTPCCHSGKLLPEPSPGVPVYRCHRRGMLGVRGARAILLEPLGAAPPASFGQWALGAAAAPTAVPPAGWVFRSGPPRVEGRASHRPSFQARLVGTPPPLGPQEPPLGVSLRGSFSGPPSGPAVGAWVVPLASARTS